MMINMGALITKYFLQHTLKTMLLARFYSRFAAPKPPKRQSQSTSDQTTAPLQPGILLPSTN